MVGAQPQSFPVSVGGRQEARPQRNPQLIPKQAVGEETTFFLVYHRVCPCFFDHMFSFISWFVEFGCQSLPCVWLLNVGLLVNSPRLITYKSLFSNSKLHM